MSKLEEIENRINDGKTVGESVDMKKLKKSVAAKRKILENDKIVVK